MSIATARLNKRDVVDVYTRNAPVYDFWGMLTEAKARNRSLQMAQIKDGEAILEVATGTGLTFEEIVRANPHGRNIGIDLTPAMLEKARSRMASLRLRSYELLPGDAYHLDFPDQQFDLLMNNYMFDLLPEKDFVPVLREFKRVLKPDGRMVLVNMTKGEHVYQRFWESVYRLNPRWLGGCRGVLLSEAIQTAGFRHLNRETSSQLGFPSEIISAKA